MCSFGNEVDEVAVCEADRSEWEMNDRRSVVPWTLLARGTARNSSFNSTGR
jgi:hypothetical protein